MSKSKTKKNIADHPLYLFVYGTLRKGECNHRRCDGHVIDVIPAKVWGKLHCLGGPRGLLMVEYPDAGIIRQGTHKPLRDASYAGHPVKKYDPKDTRKQGYGWIEGQILVLSDPRAMFQLIDPLEGYHPGRPSSDNYYHRFLTRAVLEDGTVMTVWTYGRPFGGGRHFDGWRPCRQEGSNIQMIMNMDVTRYPVRFYDFQSAVGAEVHDESRPSYTTKPVSTSMLSYRDRFKR